ncbi:type II toxin-antitoxin system RelE/ParE family toxin [Salmonella enterica]|nr:type II toxin-antitoxin system RelE/ParE family toxin [Salmonella enterica]EKB7612241.1 type II toxin-antitoxin system RelE/ParE family toxin [Salmonella enterica]
MTAYILTTDAEADLRGIIRYTRKQWGAAQVRRYIARLEHGIAGLAAGRGSFRDMSELFPELRMMHCEHHYVFCLPRGGAPALVVAIFHERMDLMARLSERLNTES